MEYMYFLGKIIGRAASLSLWVILMSFAFMQNLFATTVSPREDKVLIEEIIPVYFQESEIANPVDPIFNKRLTNEFEVKYRDKFGFTPVNQNFIAANKYTEIIYSNGKKVTLYEDTERRQEFAQFMIRRLSEFHIDDYAKRKESLKKAYEIKEKISNYELPLKEGYKLNLNYALSENSFNIKFNNPLNLETKISLLMDGSSFGPSTVEERIYSVLYPVDKKINVSTIYKQEEGIVSLQGEKRMSDSLIATLSGSSTVSKSSTSNEDLLLLSFKWIL